ncbi:mechanosensitive ion channel family protein [Crocosphaera sp. Alani8]|uniref:mechanosensitive ion channel family protein n=1 Tax=Crocosphaera sp. Alani8 TaxID=3038952 RepID=UPI00313C33A5
MIVTSLVILALLWLFINQIKLFVRERIPSTLGKLVLAFLKGNKTNKNRIIKILFGKFCVKHFVELILLLLSIIFFCYLFVGLAIPKWDFPIIRVFLIFINFFETQLIKIIQYLKDELPPLIFIVVCAYFMDLFLTRYIIKFIFPRIPLPIFHNVICKDDSAKESTIFIGHLIISIFVILLAAPHLPGAGTVYFAGISAFIVLAFTWSGSRLISDIVSGLLLIYVNPLTKGNWIKIGDIVGEVKEQNLFFHEIKTVKNCIITIPNSILFQNLTTNLSAHCDAKANKKIDKQNEDSRTLILHTPVGLGYDVPREKVEQTLIAAAAKTDNILSNPPPFVLLTYLGDFAVTYELNVHINKVNDIPKIYSDLHKSIQDECNSQDIEILSPNYVAVRDGNPTTVVSPDTI